MYIKIYFRYLFLRLFVPFAICLAGCTLIWIMVQLYSNIDDFLGHKVGLMKILYFYSLQIPTMLVQVLPAALLFSTLWTLLALNRRCELVAFQSGGMAPLWLYAPFAVFAVIWWAVLAFDLNWPAPVADLTSERVLAQVKGMEAKSNVYENLSYVDSATRRVWFFQSLDTNHNTARGVELLYRGDTGRDIEKYFARNGKWNGEFWQLTGVLRLQFNISGGLEKQTTYPELDLPDVTTPPRQLSLIVSPPGQLTFSQLNQYLATTTTNPERKAEYRTEWWYRIIFPFSVMVMMTFGLLQGARTDRRNALGGVMLAILVLIGFIASNQVFMAFGVHNRLPPLVAVLAAPVLFGLLGLHLLAVGNGLYWQALELAKPYLAEWGFGPDKPGESDASYET